MSVEESPLLREFKTFLQATLVAFGSDGAPFSLVNQRFSEDWVGSPSLKEYAAKLGYVHPNGIFKLLQSIPDQVTMMVNPTGEVILKPVPMEETRDNLEKIDATNKELKAERKRRQQYQQGPLPASVIAQLAAGICWPPPVPAQPLSSVFNASIERTAPLATPSIATISRPPPMTKKFNPNLIPLGTPRFARCASTSNIAADSSADSGPSASGGPTPSPVVFHLPHQQPQQQPQRSKVFFGQRKKPTPPVAMSRNDFGDLAPPVAVSRNDFCDMPPPTAVSRNDFCDLPPPTAVSRNDFCDLPPPAAVSHNDFCDMPPPTVVSRNDLAQPLSTVFKRNEAYYEEDFHALASPRNGSPEPRPAKEEPHNLQQPQPANEEPHNLQQPQPAKYVAQNLQQPQTAKDVAQNLPVPPPPPADSVPYSSDEDYFEDISDDSENDWDLLDGVLDHNDWNEEEDDEECGAFLDKFSQTYSKPVPEGIYRLIHIFRQSGGSFSKIDLLEKKYSDNYGTRLNSTERNRLLGAPAATRIAKDSFSKAAYPGLFRVTERMANYYGVNLLPCLTGNCVDPSLFWSASPPLSSVPSRPSTSASIKREPPSNVPSPVHSVDTTARKPIGGGQPKPADDIPQFTHFCGQTIESVLSAYSDLLDSLKEPPLSPPFTVGQFVLFRHDKLGMCHGKVVRQDSQHLVVKHLVTQDAHYVKMEAIFAFPDQLLKECSTNSLSSFSTIFEAEESCQLFDGAPIRIFFFTEYTTFLEMSDHSARRKVLLKIILLGEAGVGKSSLMNQYVNRQFVSAYKATVGCDFLTKTITVDGTEVKMQIWDTCGQERFQSLGNAFYRGSDACILVFDVTNATSFKCLESWLDEFLVLASPLEPDSFPFMVLGNKIDRDPERAVSSRKAQNWCERHGGTGTKNIRYMEASAKSAANVEEAFEAIVRDALARAAQDEQQREPVEFPDQIDFGNGRSDERTTRESSCFC
ncbi:hypothetical protein niasHS_015273 [Heterodera schachtii]|uniref:Ras-related protein Rab-7b n=1 Tax=Heterodera schachtii TaxID=97005 RepID=A0ABD2I5N1_HETSC